MDYQDSRKGLVDSHIWQSWSGLAWEQDHSKGTASTAMAAISAILALRFA